MMLSYPDEVATVTGAYSGGQCPVKSTSDIVSDTEYYYDQPGTSLTSQGTLGTLADTVPSGVQTGVRKVKLWPSGTEPFQPVSQVESYDNYGRTTAILNGNSDLTKTSYTPGYTAGATSALPETVTVTDPLGYPATTTCDQERELPVQVSDINGEPTTETYDQLGRLLSVTLPQDQAAKAATYEYSYLLTGAAPPAVTTLTLQEAGYVPSAVIYDGMLQKIQTRSPALNNQAGSVDTWQVYNSDGWVTESDPAYADQGSSPSATLVAPTATGSLKGRVLTSYDGQGRVTSTSTYSGTLVAQTTTAYPGLNEVDTTPPSGGTATTVITNALGKTTQSWAYSGATTADRATGHADITSYTYTPGGEVNTIADSAGNTWQYGYDLLGEKTSATDPGTKGTSGPSSNEGQTTYTYDADGNLSSSSVTIRGTFSRASASSSSCSPGVLSLTVKT